MNSIAKFFTIYWIVYFPACIAYNDLPGFQSVDEVMTAILIVYTFYQKRNPDTNPAPWREYFIFLWILLFYIVYSLMFGVNVSKAVWLDAIQWIRPFSIIYCTWILNPQFTRNQKKWMLGTMIITLVSWVILTPIRDGSEFPVLGQMAICCGMAFYLLTENTQKNLWISFLLVAIGLVAPKFKFMGEVVCFIGVIFFMKNKLGSLSPKTLFFIGVLLIVILYVSWERVDAYYVSGFDNEKLGRPMSYKTAYGKIIWDYFPFGPGMGGFATMAAWKCYSPLYFKYHLNNIWGFGSTSVAAGCFICDAFYPALSEFGVVGIFLFFLFWKRRIKDFNMIENIKYYKVAILALLCLIIEQTADSSFLSGKGMGYCMLIGLCLNANGAEESEIDTVS